MRIRTGGSQRHARAGFGLAALIWLALILAAWAGVVSWDTTALVGAFAIIGAAVYVVVRASLDEIRSPGGYMRD